MAAVRRTKREETYSINRNVYIKGCLRNSKMILKFIVLAFNKSKLCAALADYCTYLEIYNGQHLSVTT